MQRAFFTFFLTTLLLCSCERIENKGKELANKVKEKTKKEIKKQAKRVVDRIFPPFNHDKADTDNNKLRFKDFLQIEITPDVQNIYCFDDAIGIDADYMFSFNCNPTTSRKIIEKHKLSLAEGNSDNGFGLQHDFEWWDKEKIAKLQKYSWTNGKSWHKYYWYDEAEKKAYFFEFDL